MTETKTKSYDPAFEKRVIDDMKAETARVDTELRMPDMLESWRRMLVHVIRDSEVQFSQRRSEMAIVENTYAAGGRSDPEMEHLVSERERYSKWRRGNLSFYRAALRRLAEANELIWRYE